MLAELIHGRKSKEPPLSPTSDFALLKMSGYLLWVTRSRLMLSSSLSSPAQRLTRLLLLIVLLGGSAASSSAVDATTDTWEFLGPMGELGIGGITCECENYDALSYCPVT